MEESCVPMHARKWERENKDNFIVQNFAVRDKNQG